MLDKELLKRTTIKTLEEYKEALFWYLKAAEQEYDVAEFNV